MVNGHSRVQAAYDNLRGEQVIEGESASIPLGPSGRLRDAILVKDHVGLIHLLARLPDERERFDVPLGRLLQATWVEIGRASCREREKMARGGGAVESKGEYTYRR